MHTNNYAEKVTKSTQTRRSVVKSELRHEGDDAADGGETPAYGEEGQGDNVQWAVESDEDYERIIEPSTQSIGTSTEPASPRPLSPSPLSPLSFSPSPSPTPSWSASLVSSSKSRKIKQIRKTSFGICHSDKAGKWRQHSRTDKASGARKRKSGRKLSVSVDDEVGEDSQNVKVLQSKVYIVGQGREEEAFVQNLKPAKPRSSRVSEMKHASNGVSGKRDAEETMAEKPDSAPKGRPSKRKSSRKKKKRRNVPVEIDGEAAEIEKEEEERSEIKRVDLLGEEGEEEEEEEGIVEESENFEGPHQMEADDDDVDGTFSIPSSIPMASDVAVVLSLKRSENNMYKVSQVG